MPLDDESGLLADGRGERGQRTLQAEVFERLRAQPARDPADLFGAVARGFAQLVELLAQFVGDRRPRGPSTWSITPVSVWPTSS